MRNGVTVDPNLDSDLADIQALATSVDEGNSLARFIRLSVYCGSWWRWSGEPDPPDSCREHACKGDGYRDQQDNPDDRTNPPIVHSLSRALSDNKEAPSVMILSTLQRVDV